MSKSAIAGLFAFAFIGLASSSTVSAQAPDNTLISKDVLATTLPATVTPSLLDLNVPAPAETAAPVAPAPVEPEKYIVAERDTLSSIASSHQTTWKRLYDKNTSLASPDVITVGEEIIIPKADETLAERALPQPVVPAAPVAVQPAQQPARAAASAPSTYVARGSVSGNLYTPGYCTWYVKNKRPDLPNNLGDASTWVARASAQGMATGSAPRAGAAGQSGGHVVYVESVNGDGTVTISEMNHAGLYVVTTRTLPASYFMYIY